PRRAQAVADGLPGSVQSRTGAPARSAARYHRLGAGQRTQRARVGTEICTGRVVRRPYVALARRQDHWTDVVEDTLRRGDFGAGPRHDGRIPGIEVGYRWIDARGTLVCAFW